MLEFSCPLDLLDFLKSVGASQLPEEVKIQMWTNMQKMIEQQRRQVSAWDDRLANQDTRFSPSEGPFMSGSKPEVEQSNEVNQKEVQAELD